MKSSEKFRNNVFPLESVGALRIFAGNDKTPRIRNISKTLALTVTSQACKEDILPSFVGSNSAFSISCYCKYPFILLFLRIYFHMYRVFLWKLERLVGIQLSLEVW